MPIRLVALGLLFVVSPFCATASAQPAEPAPAEHTGSVEPRGEHLDRAVLLAPHLARQQMRDDALPWAAVLAFAAGGTAGGVAIFGDTLADSTRVAFGASGAAMIGGGVASLLAPEPWREGILATTGYLGLGGVVTGAAFGNAAAHDQEPLWPYLTAIAAGYYGTGLLWGIATVARPPTPPSRLLVDYQRLRTPELRRGLSPREVSAIEQRYRSSEPAIPRYWLTVPMLATSTAVVIAALQDERLSDDAKTTLVAVSLTQLTPALIAMVAHGTTGFPLYERELRDAGLSLSIGPGPGEAGLALSGSF